MKEQIEKRLIELKQAKEQVTAQLHAIAGAIGELEALLKLKDENSKTEA
jgi:hypothetical protein